MTSIDNNFIPYGKQSISADDIEAVLSVLASDYLTQGPQIELFEKKLCSTSSCKYATAVNSATSALHIGCLALGLGKGDILWTSPTSFVASANCARYCGAMIDFVDIDLETGLMSVPHLAEKLRIADQNNCLPKIIVPVHLAGTSCDMKAIRQLADQYNVRIIEDASHAIGGSIYRNQVAVVNIAISLSLVFIL